MSSGLSRVTDGIRKLAAPAAELDAEARARLEEERREANHLRAGAVLPVLVAIQISMLFIYRARPDGLHASFRAGVFWIHALTLPASASLAVLAWAPSHGRARGRAWLGDAVLVFAVALGLALSLNTHHLVPNLNGLIIALFSGTLIVRPTLPGAIVAYGGGLVGLIAGIQRIQPDPELRLASLTTGVTAVLITFAFSRVLDISFVRDVVQRITIARQQRELVAWNAELEKRVEAQVSETLARADEVRALDAHLRWKVRDRSRELALALRGAGELAPRLAAGSRFEQRYDIDEFVGSGAWGDVYAGRDAESGQRVAIKILRRFEGMGAAEANRFVAEAAAAASVVHPAIVRTYHVDISERGELYLVMELVGGRTLASELTRGCYDAAQAARLGAVVADALAVAHAAGVVHRDIKPENLMLSSSAPGLRVLDFGVSKIGDGAHGDTTAAGQMIGTPLYMAPEQIVSNARISGACDVYALGQVLYEMLTGAPCFSGKTVREVLVAQVTDAPMSVRTRTGGDHVPEDLSALIAQCLVKAPDQRPTAATLAAALRTLADDLSAPPLERLGPPRMARSDAAPVAVAATVRASS